MTTRERLDKTVQKIARDNPEEAAKVISLYLAEEDLIDAPLTGEEIDLLPVGSVLKIDGSTWVRYFEEWCSNAGETLMSGYALSIRAFGEPIELVRYGFIYERAA